MRSSLNMRFATLFTSTLALAALSAQSFGDEHLFGYTRTSETLPQGHFDLYQFTTLRTGKDAGRYRGWDFDTELEYGVTDKLQLGLGITQHYFHVRNNPELENVSRYRFGGVEASA